MKFASVLLVLIIPLARLGAQTAVPGAAPEPAVKMDQIVVNAKPEAQLNTIDRKIYNVGHEIQAATGSVADVLQNIPSVQVDIDGNISLRGDSSVQILVDGRSSALMGNASRADVLSQMPADSIERIEVITNPSAMYKPDGTGGIINIVLKKKHAKGYSASVRVTAGNNRRYGISVGGNFDPGPYNLFGNYAARQDDRPRVSTDQRSYIDPTTNLPAQTQNRTTEVSRPFFQIGQAGLEYNAGPHDKLTEVVDFSYRTFDRHALEHDTVENNLGVVTTDYQRLRFDPENEGNVQSKSTYEHDFGRDDKTLTVEVRAEHHTETERNHYTNVYATPLAPVSLEYIRVSTNEPGTEVTAEFADAIGKSSKLELGLDRSEDKSSQDHLDLVQDPLTGAMVSNAQATNSFYLDQTVTALYGTYRRVWGNWGALFGARGEAADLATNQITSKIVSDQKYYRFYPSLHFTYDLTPTQQLQFNYSHRVRRPESDDLNPYPRYQDPYNVQAGNPYLKPEEVHSIEAGYQYKNDETTYLATLFYRYTYNGFTQVSRYISSTTLLTTEENLGKSQSGGLELATTVSPLDKVTLNGSADIYYNQIDASNLGYSSRQSTIAWSAKLSAEYAYSKTSLFQVNTNYSAKRLTPQGYRAPTFVANLGYKHDFPGKKLSVIVTISDLFNSLRDETKLTTPALQDDSTRRRSARIFSAGLIYTFGTAKAKAKGDALQFDNQL